jgi:hypothetical protein
MSPCRIVVHLDSFDPMTAAAEKPILGPVRCTCDEGPLAPYVVVDAGVWGSLGCRRCYRLLMHSKQPDRPEGVADLHALRRSGAYAVLDLAEDKSPDAWTTLHLLLGVSYNTVDDVVDRAAALRNLVRANRASTSGPERVRTLSARITELEVALEQAREREIQLQRRLTDIFDLAREPHP